MVATLASSAVSASAEFWQEGGKQLEVGRKNEQVCVASLAPRLLCVLTQQAQGVLEFILLDTGASTHVCPLGWALDHAVDMEKEEDVESGGVCGADGRVLKSEGRRKVWCQMEGAEPMALVFEVLQVIKPILAMKPLADAGFGLRITSAGASLRRKKECAQLSPARSVWFAPVNLLAAAPKPKALPEKLALNQAGQAKEHPAPARLKELLDRDKEEVGDVQSPCTLR